MTMPEFVIKAKDRLSLDAIAFYATLCEGAGLDNQAREVQKAYNEFREWQRANPDALKFPDHAHVPARERPARRPPTGGGGHGWSEASLSGDPL